MAKKSSWLPWNKYLQLGLGYWAVQWDRADLGREAGGAEHQSLTSDAFWPLPVRPAPIWSHPEWAVWTGKQWEPILIGKELGPCIESILQSTPRLGTGHMQGLCKNTFLNQTKNDGRKNVFPLNISVKDNFTIVTRPCPVFPHKFKYKAFFTLLSWTVLCQKTSWCSSMQQSQLTST